MANVAVTNTTGLYGLTTTTTVLNSAQQLLTILDNNGNVNFALDPTTSNTKVLAYFVGSITSSYGNANVAAYLPHDPTITTIEANLGAFETYANATFGTSSYGNSNVATYLPHDPTITTIQANIGAFETYSNANVGAIYTHLNTLDANVGAFETYANLTFGTNNYGNANVAAYLPNYNGNIEAANVNISQFITLSTPNNPSYAKGLMWYDSIQDSVSYYNSVSNNEVNVGQETQFKAYNNTGSTIVQGAPVYITGLNGSTPNIALAQGNTLASAQVAGVANQSIPANSIGYVVSSGLVANVLMVSYKAGDILYLSSSTPGVLQNYAPSTGYVTKVGVVSANIAQGSFLTGIINPVNNQTFGNLTVTGNLNGNNATITNLTTSGNTNTTGTTTTGNLITTSGIFWANGVNMFSNINSNTASLQSQINTINANIGAFEIYSNANVGTITLNLQTLNANVGAYEIYSNANASTLATSINTLNANLGAFETYANATFGGATYSNVQAQGYLSGTTQLNIGNSAPTNSQVVIGNYNTSSTTIIENNGSEFIVGAIGGNVSISNPRGMWFEYTDLGFYAATGNINLNWTVGSNFGGNINGANVVTAQSYTTSNGVFWANGAVYSTYSVAGNIVANPGYYFLGNGSQLTGLTASQIANLPTAPGFSGNLGGNVLYDGINQRVFANAYPLSTPSTSVVGNYFSNYLQNAPVYTNSILQAPIAPVSPVNSSSIAVAQVTTGNVSLQSSYQTTNNRTTSGTLTYFGVMPATANTMTTSDRIRGATVVLEVNPQGKIWNGTQTGSQVVAQSSTASVVGNGTLQSVIGTLNSIVVTPISGNANVTYGTGAFTSISFSSSNGTQYQGNIQQARLYAGSIASITANLSVNQAIGLHTTNGWAGTVGTTGGAATAYALLNEDTTTQIQTNGNLNVSGNVAFTSNIKLAGGNGQLVNYRDKVLALGSTGGSIAFDVSQAPTYTLTLTSNLTGSFTNMPAGSSLTLVITQDGTGGRTQSWSGVKWAGGSSTLSTGAGAIDIINFYFDGTNYYGSLVKGYV